MKLNALKDVDGFIQAVNSCKGNVFLTSIYGDRYNIKSTLMQYVGIAKLIGNNNDLLELWCDNEDDRELLMKFLV